MNRCWYHLGGFIVHSLKASDFLTCLWIFIFLILIVQKTQHTEYSSFLNFIFFPAFHLPLDYWKLVHKDFHLLWYLFSYLGSWGNDKWYFEAYTVHKIWYFFSGQGLPCQDNAKMQYIWMSKFIIVTDDKEKHVMSQLSDKVQYNNIKCPDFITHINAVVDYCAMHGNVGLQELCGSKM